MTISWNEIRTRAIAFSKEWESETNERAEAKSFWDDFFNVFGVRRRRVATFEERVHPADDKDGYIDLLWKGTLLVEHKSKGKNLDSAFQQAKDYFPGILDNDLPRYVVVADFARFRLYDLDECKSHEFTLKDLHSNIHLFGFMSGHQRQLYPPQDPVNIKAAEAMGKLHDRLKASNYSGHELEVYLVRILFCLFADATGIFEKNAFREYIDTKTKTDGTDLALHLAELFEVLDTPADRRLLTLDEDLRTFPYVDGKLFEGRLRLAAFDSSMRKQLLDCATLDWGRISPAIFGSLFQSVMNPQERRELGAHYTEERNILKVIRSLFLDELNEEFERSKNNLKRLDQLHQRMAGLKFLDPACGCGNFLVIAYRELRLLELEILKLKQKGQTVIDAEHLLKLDVDQFYGLELEDFPAQIAQVALWLMDHQMNNQVELAFGEPVVRLPLKKSPNIHCVNALRQDWHEIVKSSELSYILGNPPFVGQTYRSNDQNEDMKLVFESVPNKSPRHNSLDYVSAWYVKAAQYIQGTDIRVAFVSTKSITQGEQVGPLWSILLNTYPLKIQFAHQTFKWTNEARGKAAVHCIIIGFGLSETHRPAIFDYETVESEPHRVEVKHINPYLVDAPDILLFARSKPMCECAPEGRCGNKPVDDGNYLFTKMEKDAFITEEPAAAKYMRRWIGSKEFINGVERYCLWLGDATPTELRSMPEVMKRIDAVRAFRLKSTTPGTRKTASTPTRFFFENMPTTAFVIIPETSSEKRNYIPIGFLTPDHLTSNAVHILPNATLYHFGVLTSSAHMAWARRVCGRMKSDYRYSLGIVYNNFPWPKAPSSAQVKAVEKCAQDVLDVRKKLLVPGTSLADIYDPLTMPPELVHAHQKLDQAVDRCYRAKPFASELSRVRHLFALYQEYCPSATPLEAYSYEDEDEKAN